MKLIGYWMQSLLDEHLPLPQELVGQCPDEVREAVCKYLENGTLFEQDRGYSWCRFRCGVPNEEMGSCEFTDGEWVWPQGLVHYVRLHSVVLPAEFIAKATSGDVPNFSAKNCETLDFWIAWARDRRSADLRERLSLELAAARTAEPFVIETIIEQIRLKNGEGENKCAFADCDERALVGRRICARHTMSDDQIKWRTAELYRLPNRLLWPSSD